jgi:hypothetical protein
VRREESGEWRGYGRKERRRGKKMYRKEEKKSQTAQHSIAQHSTAAL